MAVRELLTKLGFKVDEAGAKRAESIYERLKEGAKGAASTVLQIGTNLAGLSTSVSALLSPSQLLTDLFGRLTRETVHQVAELEKWSTRLGIGTAQLSELSFAARATNTDTKDLLEGLTDLAEKASDVFRNDPKGTSDAGESFKALGINVRGAGGQLKPVSELFEEVLEKLPKVKDAGDRTGIAMRLFGDDVGRKLVPFLAKGSDGIAALRAEARALGVVIDADAVQAAKRFTEAQGRLGATIEAVGVKVATLLLPGLTRTVDAFQALLSADRVARGVDVLDRALGFLGDRGRVVAHVLSTILNLVGGLRGPMTGLRNILIAVAAATAIWALASLGNAVIQMRAVHVSVTALTASLWRLVAAQIAAVAGPALIGAAFVATVALVGLLIEDLYVHVNGGKSAIGELISTFLDKPPGADEHWLLTTLRDILNALRAVGRAVGWVGRASGEAWMRLTGERDELDRLEHGEEARRRVIQLYGARGAQALRRGYQPREILNFPQETVFGPQSEMPADRRGVYEVPAAIRAIAERGPPLARPDGRERFAASAAARSPQGAPTTVVQGGVNNTVAQTVVVNGGDPAEVRKAAMQGAEDALAKQNQRAYDSLRRGVVK